MFRLTMNKVSYNFTYEIHCIHDTHPWQIAPHLVRGACREPNFWLLDFAKDLVLKLTIDT